MERLLNELLELSRVGRLMNRAEDLPFKQIVEEALIIVESQLKDKQIAMVIHNNLPIVQGDKVRLIEVIQNLVGNAAKFMGEQTKPKIEIGVIKENDETIFFVRDNGIGIDPAYHEKVLSCSIN